MKTYRVKTRCFGFKRKLWEVGQIVDLGDNETPPHHFVLISSTEAKEAKKVVVEKPMSFSEMQKAEKKDAGGFASGLNKKPFGKKKK